MLIVDRKSRSYRITVGIKK